MVAAEEGQGLKRPAEQPAAGLPPIAKAKSVTKAPPPGKAGAVAKAPPPAAAAAAEEIAAPATPPPAGEEAVVGAVGPQKVETWREYEETDPLYALLGQVGSDKVFKGEEFFPDLMDKYLEKIFGGGVTERPKDWVEIWASMDIPVDRQPLALTPIMKWSLKMKPEETGMILAELLKGHRTKSNTIVESVIATMKDTTDPCGVLQEFLYTIYPRGAASPWGWSRIGWSWQEWWKIAVTIISALTPSSAFDEMATLLNRIEAVGLVPLARQQIWNGKRLESAREVLLKFSELESEADLFACIDATLR